MSDPRAKAERSKAKDARQQAAPDAPSNGRKRKRKKPFWFEVTLSMFGWTFRERYATRKAAETGRAAALKSGNYKTVSEIGEEE